MSKLVYGGSSAGDVSGGVISFVTAAAVAEQARSERGPTAGNLDCMQLPPQDGLGVDAGKPRQWGVSVWQVIGQGMRPVRNAQIAPAADFAQQAAGLDLSPDSAQFDTAAVAAEPEVVGTDTREKLAVVTRYAVAAAVLGSAAVKGLVRGAIQQGRSAADIFMGRDGEPDHLSEIISEWKGQRDYDRHWRRQLRAASSSLQPANPATSSIWSDIKLFLSMEKEPLPPLRVRVAEGVRRLAMSAMGIHAHAEDPTYNDSEPKLAKVDTRYVLVMYAGSVLASPESRASIVRDLDKVRVRRGDVDSGLGVQLFEPLSDSFAREGMAENAYHVAIAHQVYERCVSIMVQPYAERLRTLDESRRIVTQELMAQMEARHRRYINETFAGLPDAYDRHERDIAELNTRLEAACGRVDAAKDRILGPARAAAAELVSEQLRVPVSALLSQRDTLA